MNASLLTLCSLRLISVGMLGVVQIATLPTHEAVDALLIVRRSDKRHSVGRLMPSRGALRAAREEEMLSGISSTSLPSFSSVRASEGSLSSESRSSGNDDCRSSLTLCWGYSFGGGVTVVTPVTPEPLAAL